MGSRAETTERLVTAARELIVRQGAEGCSVEQICQHAGFSRGAFYSNFSSKNELFAAVAVEEYERLVDGLEQVVDVWTEQAPATGGGDEFSVAADMALMGQLLDQVLVTLHLDEDFYILQNELLIRSVRDPNWAREFHPINVGFVRELATVLDMILTHVGRRPTGDLMVTTHAVIGLVLRAACVGSWVRTSLRARGAELDESVPVTRSRPAADLVGMIVTVLHAQSEPLRSSRVDAVLGRIQTRIQKVREGLAERP